MLDRRNDAFLVIENWGFLIGSLEVEGIKFEEGVGGGLAPSKPAGSSRVAGAFVVRWGAHLAEHAIKPGQRAIHVNFQPAGRGRDILASVLAAPALHERHANCAQSGQREDGLKALLDRRVQQLPEFGH